MRLAPFLLLRVASALVNNQTYSAECATPTNCTLVPGRTDAALAWGRFDDGIERVGSADLWISSATVSVGAGFAAGYVEGALCAERIAQHYANLAAAYGVDPPSANLTAFLDANDAWLDEQLAGAPEGDAYWGAIAFVRAQLDGLAAGYALGRAALAAAPPPLTRRQLLMLNLQGDLTDVLKAVDPASRPDARAMSDGALRRYTRQSTHCSALVKLAADFSELYVGHNMWWGWYVMLPVNKRYAFGAPAYPHFAAVLMTSYPGMLASTDDFYVVPSTRLAVMETTNPNYNASSYDLVTPRAVLYFARVMAANYLARNGSAWMDLAARHNSGTYNNMWMVVDYKLFTPRRSLPPGTLWVGEQAPGYWHAEDMTHVLAYGHWPSYNKALFAMTARITGQDAVAAERGEYYGYSLTPRAEIFRRDAGGVANETGMARLLRYNRWQTDPLANGSACDQLACRADLLVDETPAADGAVNAKFTSASRVARGEMRFIAGPTSDDQPVFQWSTAPASVRAEPHAGQPDRWDFPWQTLQLEG